MQTYEDFVSGSVYDKNVLYFSKIYEGCGIKSLKDALVYFDITDNDLRMYDFKEYFKSKLRDKKLKQLGV